VRTRYRKALAFERADIARAKAEFKAARDATRRLQVHFDGPVTRRGEYGTDDDTLLLFHFNKWFDAKPVEVAKGATCFVDGKLGSGAVQVKDTGIVYELPAEAARDTGSMELWVKPGWSTTDGKSHTALSLKGPGDWNQNWLAIYKNKDYSVQFTLFDRHRKELILHAPIGIFQRGQWTHLCATWNKNIGTKLYINGKLHAQHDDTFDIEALHYLTIGHSWGSPWDGTIDEVRISSTERTPGNTERR